jgi:single-stranded DNA-binding protein
VLLNNRDIAKLKRELKHGPQLTRIERVEYLRRTIVMLGNSERSLNRTVVTGLLRNQKIHVTANQNKLCTFTLCVIEGTKDGSKKTFVDCISWNGQGERIAALPEESKVYVTGKLQTYSWTDRASGQKRYKLQIACDSAEAVPNLNSRPMAQTTESRPISDEDIPF